MPYYFPQISASPSKAINKDSFVSQDGLFAEYTNWDFTSSSMVDNQGNSGNISITGASLVSASDNKSYFDFDGVNDTGTGWSAFDWIDGESVGTWCMWVRLNQTIPDLGNVVLMDIDGDLTATSNPLRLLIARVDSNGGYNFRTRFGLGDPQTFYLAGSQYISESEFVGNWFFVCMGFDISNTTTPEQYIYINGVEAGIGSIGTGLVSSVIDYVDPTGSHAVGSSFFPDSNAECDIAYVSLYNKALTQEEAYNNYLVTKTLYGFD